MKNSKIELIFSIFFIFIFIFALISQKMAYNKMIQKNFPQIFMKILIYCIFSDKYLGRLFKILLFRETFIRAGRLSTNLRYC